MIADDGLIAAAQAGFKRPPVLTISQWADRNRILSSESSAEPGRWDTSRAEYQREMMDVITDPLVENVVIMSGSQIGKSEVLNNALGFFVDCAPCPILFMQPTLQMAEAYSKDRIAPMIRDTLTLKDEVADVAARDGGNTLLHKQFPGGHLTLTGANSPASLASRPIRVLLCDEIDRFPPSAGTEGDPVGLAMRRTATFWGRKHIICSTPGTKGASRIEIAFEASDQRRYYVPCPHCHEMQILIWEQVKWTPAPPAEAQYECAHCERRWSEGERAAAVAQGQWRATKPFTGTAGFHLNELYSPWVRLGTIATNFLAAKDHPEALKLWVNTALGQLWEDPGESVAMSALQRRAEPYPLGWVPDEALILSTGIDAQKNRLELLTVGWGDGMQCWVIDRQVFDGDISSLLVFENLAAHLAIPLECENGGLVLPRVVAVDSGAFTQEIYSFVRANALRRLEHGLQEIMAVKGVAQWSSPAIGKPTEQDIDYRGNKISRGVRLWPVGSSTIKQSLYAWLRIETPGPHYVHFSDELPEVFYDQLTSERLQTRYRLGHPFQEWHLPSGRRNEALDCITYALAGAYRMGLPQFRPPQWEQLRSQRAQIANVQRARPMGAGSGSSAPLAPATATAPSDPAAAAPGAAHASATPAPAPAPPRRPHPMFAPGFSRPVGYGGGNWVKSWRK